MAFVAKRVWFLVAALVVLQSGLALGREQVRRDTSFTVREGEPLKVRLEVDAGTLRVRRGDEARTVGLRVAYNPDVCDLDLDFDPDRNLLRVRLDVKSWFRQQKESGRDVARVELDLPSAVDVEFRARTKASEADLELGGLRLTRLELKVLAGETRLRFGKPNLARLRRMKITEKVGELEVEKLGNARFEDGEISAGIGDLRVDLSGEEPPDFDQDLELHLGMGAAELEAPADWPVRFEISKLLAGVDVSGEFHRREGGYESATYRKAEHTLNVYISEHLGSVEIIAR